jgi:hypothetical protein
VWLARLAWRVVLVVCWVSCRSGAVWMGTAAAPAAQATTSTRLGVPFTRQIAGYGHDHRVCGCVTNCVTITTYDNGLT